MRNILFFILILGGSFGLNAQNAIDLKSFSSDWMKIAEQDGVQIEAMLTPCDINGIDKQFDYVFFRLVNTNAFDVEVSFASALHFSDGDCDACEPSAEQIKMQSLKANSTVFGDCSFKNSQLSTLIRNPFIITNGVLPISLEIINLNVTK